MTSASFPAHVTSRFIAVWLVVSAGLVFAGGVTFFMYRTWDFGRSFLVMLFLLVMPVIAWRNRERPVLEITNEEIRWAPISWWNPKRIPIRDVDNIDASSTRKVIIRLRSGHRVVVRIRQISPAHRDRALNGLIELKRKMPSRA